MGSDGKSTYLLNFEPPEPPDDLNFWVGGFGGLDGGFWLLCSLVGMFLGGSFCVFAGFFTGCVTIFLG